MIILAVDTDPDRLWELVHTLRQAFPDDTVEYTHDPLMAGRFGYNYPVDALYAQADMKRKTGADLAGFLRRKNPMMSVFLIADSEEPRAGAAPADSGIDGWLSRPVTLQALEEIAVCRFGKRPSGKAAPL